VELLGSGPQQPMHLGVGLNVVVWYLMAAPRTRVLHLYTDLKARLESQESKFLRSRRLPHAGQFSTCLA
jgi:hypothetical protein